MKSMVRCVASVAIVVVSEWPVRYPAMNAMPSRAAMMMAVSARVVVMVCLSVVVCLYLSIWCDESICKKKEILLC